MEKILKLLRAIGLLLNGAGFALSLYYMFRHGADNPSLLLIGLFTGWVSLPFVVLVFVDKQSVSWAPPARMLLYATMEGIAILSSLIYGGVVSFPNVRPAFPFLAVPAFSLLFIAIVYWTALRMTRNNF